MLNVRLASDNQYGKLLFTWLPLVMSSVVSFCAVFFPRGVLDEIWDWIESVSEGVPTYSELATSKKQPDLSQYLFTTMI